MIQRLSRIRGRRLSGALVLGGLVAIAVILGLSYTGQRAEASESSTTATSDLEEKLDQQLELFEKEKMLPQADITEMMAATIFDTNKGDTEVISYRFKQSSQEFARLEYPTVEISGDIEGTPDALIALLEKLIVDSKRSMVIDSLEWLNKASNLWDMRFHAKVYAEPQ